MNLPPHFAHCRTCYRHPAGTARLTLDPHRHTQTLGRLQPEVEQMYHCCRIEVNHA